MMTMFVIPVKGARVPYPNNPGKFLPEEGADVPETSYWQRRVTEGVVKFPEPKSKKTPKKKGNK